MYSHLAIASPRFDALTAFGLVAVTLMLLCYAMEDRSPGFVLGFAAACLMGSAYGFLQGAWPFGVVEGVWTLVALRRWRVERRRQTAVARRWRIAAPDDDDGNGDGDGDDQRDGGGPRRRGPRPMTPDPTQNLTSTYLTERI
jgi:hypothetical protein